MLAGLLTCVRISLKTPNWHTLGAGERRREGNRFRFVLAENEQKIPLHGVEHDVDGDAAVRHDTLPHLAVISSLFPSFAMRSASVSAEDPIATCVP